MKFALLLRRGGGALGRNHFNIDFEAAANFIQKGLGDGQINVRNNPDARANMFASFGKIEKRARKHQNYRPEFSNLPPLEKLLVNGERTATPDEIKKLAEILNSNKAIDNQPPDQRISVMLPKFNWFKVNPDGPVPGPEVVTMSVRQAVLLRNTWFPRGFKIQHRPQWRPHV